ncbi:hypothetical protein CsSME_00015652 [Camellia sinensis var. sinensis]
MSGAALFIKDDLKISDVQLEVLMGIMSLYSLLGCYAAGRTSDWVGRRYTIVIAAAIFFVGAILMGFATNYAFLMVGRFVAGIGVGYALLIAPVYTAEVSPAGIPEECNDDVVPVPKRSHGEGVWKELVLHPTPTVLHILIAGVGIHFFQQASGIDAVVLYSPKIFEKAGITSKSDKLLATVAVGFTKTIFILVATFLLDRVGRRPLLLSSVGGMILSLAGLAVSLTIIDHSEKKVAWAVALAITTVLSFVGTFSIGMGPIAWVYSSEIFPLRLRAQGTSIGTAMNRLISGTISMTFISLYNAISIGGAFFLFMGVAIVSWVFFYTLLPETQGRTLEEMQVLFGTFFKWRSTLREMEKNKKIRDNDNSNGQIQLGTTPNS